jgi:hypothetical protein
MPVIGPSGTTLYGNGLSQPYQNAGAPGANFLAGVCVVGSLLIDTTNGKLYICTATNGTTTATWTVVGTQV